LSKQIAEQPWSLGGMGYRTWHKYADGAYLSAYVHNSMMFSTLIRSLHKCSQMFGTCAHVRRWTSRSHRHGPRFTLLEPWHVSYTKRPAFSKPWSLLRVCTLDSCSTPSPF
jgi:hypothetical protein